MTPTSAPLRLLVVDDDRVDRMAVIRALERIDVRVQVTEAEDVSTARAALTEGSFDLVVVDHNLPDGEAPDVLALARDRVEPVPVIVLTGQGDEDLAVELMKEGARDYIPKAHLSPARLGQSIRHVVEVSRAEAETRRARSAQRFLVEVSAELARSLEYDETVARIPGLAVPAMADYALLHLRSGDRIRLAAAAHADPEAEARLAASRVLERPLGVDSPLFQAIESGEPVLVEEVDDAWMERAALDDEHLGSIRENAPRSVILAPLRARGRVLGGLAVAYSTSGRVYDNQDVAVIQNLAGRAALALDNARLYHEVRNEVHLVDTLRSFGESITARLEVESVIDEVTDRATELAGADFGVYYHTAPDADPETVQIHCATGIAEEALAGVRPPFGDEVVRRDGGWETLGAGGAAERPPLESYLLAPVRSDERIIGGMLFGHRDAGAFDERAERIVRGVAGWAAVAIQNARLYEGAQEATRARDDTLAVVSHDLRNPLNVIATSAALILEIPLPEEKKRTQLETIKRTTERMNRLIQDLLDVTSIEAGRLNIQPAPVAAAELLDDACESMAALVEEEGLTLVREHPDRDCLVHVDRERIAQVFGNLIGNAIRYTPDGGRITVGARGDDDEVSFWVEDTGRGIPTEQHAHLFDRFWRAEHQGATGAGLGLPIARGIVEMHGGRIEVDSQIERGTRFTFTIPAGGRRDG